MGEPERPRRDWWRSGLFAGAVGVGAALLVVAFLWALPNLPRPSGRAARPQWEWSRPVFVAVTSFAALVCYTLVMRSVRVQAESGGAFARFLEQVRRAIAFESPEDPKR